MLQKPHLHSNQLAREKKPENKKKPQPQNQINMQCAILSNWRAKHQQLNPPSFLNKNYPTWSMWEFKI